MHNRADSYWRLRFALPLLGCVACTSSPASVSHGNASEAEPLPFTLKCKELAGQVDAPSHGYATILDVVALTASPGGPVLQARPDRDGWMFAKSGLLVRAGAKVVLAAAEPSKLRIMWGNRRAPVAALTVPGCNGTQPWLAYPGGYWVREPSCVALIVRAGERRERVQVGVGAACPGQTK